MDNQQYFETLSSFNNALVKHHLENGGLLSLSWEELNEVERDVSLYNSSIAIDLLDSLETHLKPHVPEEDMEYLEVEQANCGLCINIPPIKPVLVEGVMKVLHKYLSDEDIESLEWDVCNEDGTSYW